MDIMRQIERHLLRVDKPARYVGGEFNTIVKPDAEVDVRIALAFPDLYDIGMSYHGFKILYERINAMQGFQAERVFAPWTDFEALLRELKLPLYMLESKRPLREAHVVGFTLQHEMNYTNIPNMLDLGGIPVLASNRTEADPLVIAGGHGAFNPEVLADFVDAFVIGDGEWAIVQILEAVRDSRGADQGEAPGQRASRFRGDGSRAKRKAVPTFANAELAYAGEWRDGTPDISREELLLRLSRIPGVYVPRFYTPRYNADGTLASIRPKRPDVPETVTKTNFDVRDDLGSTKPVVPLMRVVHDRFAIEIKRGCMVGCRFCQAGMITRPLRERDPRQIVEIAREGIRNTGYDEVSLLSLSSADYSGIVELTRALRQELADQKVSISLPSLRINAFDVELADEIGHVRKSGFTFAPEAGTARLREVINKSVDEQRFHETIEKVLRKGWRTLKFYFMCGLPTETDDDLQGIVDLTEKAIALGRKYHGKGFKLNVSLSPFIPKPQTPFQWHAQPTREEFERKYEYVESRIDRRMVSFKKHNLDESIIEGVLSRGDRRVGKAIMRAWELGCRFDNWHEQLRFDLWLQSFAETGVDPDFYASRGRGKDEVLPWDHIDASLGKRFLWKEKTRGELVKHTDDCSKQHCAGCNVCDFEEVKNVLSENEDGKFEGTASAPAPAAEPEAPPEPVQRMRVFFSRDGAVRFISHLDLQKVVQLIFKRTGVQAAYTQGFNPLPKIQFAPPLPMGFGGDAEPMDVVLVTRYAPEDLLALLGSISVEGLTWLRAEEIPLRSPALEVQLEAASYRVLAEAVDVSIGVDEVRGKLDAFLGASEFVIELEAKSKGKPGTRKTQYRDLRPSVRALSLGENGAQLEFGITIALRDGRYINPVVALESILGVQLRDRCIAYRGEMAFADRLITR